MLARSQSLRRVYTFVLPRVCTFRASSCPEHVAPLPLPSALTTDVKGTYAARLPVSGSCYVLSCSQKAALFACSRFFSWCCCFAPTTASVPLRISVQHRYLATVVFYTAYRADTTLSMRLSKRSGNHTSFGHVATCAVQFQRFGRIIRMDAQRPAHLIRRHVSQCFVLHLCLAVECNGCRFDSVVV